MGMRIGGSGNAWATQQSTSVNQWQQRHQNFKSLKTALQSNDLAGAQQAFAALSAGNPNALANPNSVLSQMGKALQAGNMPAAQQVAQNWQSQQGNAAAQPSTDPNAALASFLQTLSASTPGGTSATAGGTPADTSSTPAAASTASTPTQIAQALLSFEKNLFDSLQLQNKSNGQNAAPSLSAPAPVPAADPSVATASTAPLTQTVTDTPQTQPQHHHHHGGHGGGSQLGAQLSALMAQTGQGAASTTAGTSPSADVAGLDQSFKSLLSTLGVTGNNASLNTFLQSMSSSMPA